MSLLSPSKLLPAHHRAMYDLGVKVASQMVPSYALSGVLYGKSGDHGDWAMLSVPNALVRGVFRGLDAPGVELPPADGESRMDAHITVMRPEELDEIGGLDKLTERGKRFRYNLGQLVDFDPVGWAEMSRCWAIRVHSPELQDLRRSYGLSSLPNEGRYAFHITVAVRRKGVLGRNVRTKGRTP